MTKFCTNCGAQAKDGVKFCSSCGQAVQLAVQTEQPIKQIAYPVAGVKNKSKALFVIACGAGITAMFALMLVFTNIFGLFSRPDGGEQAAATTYEIFGDGKLIKEPQRLRAKASADDGLSAAALAGPWEGTRSSINTEYGFSDDGYFYKNTMINNSYMTSTYHPGHMEYGAYYDTYYSGYWTYGTNFSYTYLDTLVGEYRVKGGVIEFDHVVAISHTTFEDDWYNKKTRSVSIEQLQREAKNAKLQEDFSLEFEFIDPTRVRFRDESADIDLFWDMKDNPHNVRIPKHEIPAVDWPERALSTAMPEFKTKGRVREASLSYSGNDPSIKAEFKTVTLVIDKTNALPEIDAYGSSLKKSGWWVEDYQLNSDDTYLSFEARKGMFKLMISNGRGSGTSADTIVIESTKYPEGRWPAAWSKATLEPPDKSTVVGDIKADKNDDKNIYENITFDKADEGGVNTYRDNLISAGFKKPQNGYTDWELMKYIRIDNDLYLAEVRLDKRMDELSSFTYDLTYVPDGKWPDIWKNAGLPAPEGIETIAGAIDAVQWADSISDYAYASEYIKFLGLSAKGVDEYLNKLKSLGFKQVEDSWDDSVKLYSYLRIDGSMIRVEAGPIDNEDIAEIRYSFNYYEDGIWPKIWHDGGLPVPEGIDAIIGAIDLKEWEQCLGDYGYDYERVKFLGLSAEEAEQYLSKLKSLGFRQVEDAWDDSVQLYNYLRIDSSLYRLVICQEENDELTEFSYSFNYYEDGEWPSAWAAAGIPAPSFTAMLGKIDMAEFGEYLSDYGSYYERVMLLGANLPDYAAVLRNNGFTEPEYSYSDTWELEKRVQLDGKWIIVTISDTGNPEIPEISVRFNCEYL